VKTRLRACSERNEPARCAVVCEMFVFGWMPVTGFEDRLAAIQKTLSSIHLGARRLHHRSPRPESRRTEVILHVYYYQCFFFSFSYRTKPPKYSIVFHLILD